MFCCYYNKVLKQIFSSDIEISVTFHVKTFHPNGKVKVENGHLVFSYLGISLIYRFYKMLLKQAVWLVCLCISRCPGWVLITRMPQPAPDSF